MVTDSKGNPVVNATIGVEQGKDVHSGQIGDYFRLLSPGTHKVLIFVFQTVVLDYCRGPGNGALHVRRGDPKGN